MKRTQLKKVLSLVLTVVILLTVCIQAPLNASAATVQVTTNNSGTVSTVDATVGQELPRPTGISGMNFIGWYSDTACTAEYGTVQSGETRTAYAKYDKTLITYEQHTDYVADTDYRDGRIPTTSTSGVVVDPTNPNNHVFKLHSPDIYSNLQLPEYEAAGAPYYTLISNHSYTFTFKFMIPDTMPTSTFVIRCNKGNTPTGDPGRSYFGDKTYTTADITPGKWYTYTTTYNVGDTSKQTGIQAVFYVANTTYDTNYIYFDDMTITDNDADYAVAPDNYYTGFENAVVTYSGEFDSSDTASISTVQAKAGINSLRIAPTGTNQYRSYVYNGEKSAIKLIPYTNYEGSYWYYAESASSGDEIHLERVSGASVWNGNFFAHKYSVDATETGKWIKVDFKLNSGDCAAYPYLIFNLKGNKDDVFYFDEFTIKATGKEYVDYNCEFDADFSFYTTPADQKWPYYCSGSASDVLWTQTAGVVSFTTSHTSAEPSTTSTKWVQHFAPYNGSFFSFESNKVYTITIRYKQTLTSNQATGRFSIGLKADAAGSQGIKSLVINNMTGTTDWQEYTFNVTTGTLTDKVMTLTMGVSSGTATFDLDYIKVTEGAFMNNSGELSKIKTAVGSELPAPTAENGLEFIGWFSDVNCTTPYGAVQELETRTAYAKYDKTVITFGQTQYSPQTTYRDDPATYNNGTSLSGIVLDPTDQHNNVFKFYNPGIWGNMVIPSYDTEGTIGYKLTDNSKYTISFDYMIPEEITATYLNIRLMGGAQSTGGASGNRSPYHSTLVQYKLSEVEKGVWHTYTQTFTATGTSLSPYAMYAFLLDDDSNAGNDVANAGAFGLANYIYVDNVTVYNESAYETVTTNNRGYISEDKVMIGQELLPLRSVDEANFQGWYSDADCTVPYGAVQAGETRTAYAKYDTVKVSFNADSSVNGLTKLDNGYALKFDATATAQQFTVPYYDAASAGNITVEAGKTYAARFIYKLTAGSDAGYISVLGNKQAFKATSDGTDGWVTGAVTFTTATAGDLTFEVASNSTSTVYIDEFIVYEVSGKPATSVTSGNSTIDATAPTAQNNMLTGTVTVNLAAGENLGVKGLTVTYDLYATAFSEEVSSKIIFAEGSYDLDKDNTMGNAGKFVYSVPAAAKNIKISAEFVSESETNMAIIAGSIREKTETVTSGIRFRGRVYKDANITEVGFLLAPQRLITAAGQTTLTLENAESCSAIVGDATDIIYDETDKYIDRQVILANVDNLLSTDIVCVMYVKYQDNTVKYTEAATQSYNSLNEKITKVYRGITSYYYEEYEDTRDKLIQKSEDGSFSAIMVTDTHVDYSLDTTSSSSADIKKFYTTEGRYYERPAIHRTIAMIVELANTSDVDCIVLGGDMIHGTEGRDSALADLHLIADMLSKAKVPVYVNKGNHDNNDYHGDPCALKYIISTDTWTEEFLKPLAKNTEIHDANNPTSAYYYVDFPEKNTRLIVLSPYSYPITSSDGVHCDTNAENWNHIEDAQMKWFATVALDTEKQDWNYVFSAHGPITGPEPMGSAEEVKNIINAFNNKTTIDVAGITVDYTNAGSYIPYSISGHTHVSSYRHVTGSRHIAINTGSSRMANYPNSSLYNNNSQDYTYYNNGRYEGTYTEALFDVYIANSDASVIDRINFGPNCDNTFTAGDSRYSVSEVN